MEQTAARPGPQSDGHGAGRRLRRSGRMDAALSDCPRILVADEENFKKERRREFLARAATGDWDAIINGNNTHSSIPAPAVGFEYYSSS